jgi:hypothetical protein
MLQAPPLLCTAEVVAQLNAQYDADAKAGVRLGEAADLDQVKLPFRLCFREDLRAQVVTGWKDGKHHVLALGSSAAAQYIASVRQSSNVTPAAGTPLFLEPSSDLNVPDGKTRFISAHSARWLRWQRRYATDSSLHKLARIYERHGKPVEPLFFFLRIQPVLWGLGGVWNKRQLLEPSLRVFQPQALLPLLTAGIPQEERARLHGLLGDTVYARWHLIPRPDGVKQARASENAQRYLQNAADRNEFDLETRTWRVGTQPRDPFDSHNLNFAQQRARYNLRPTYWKGTDTPVPTTWSRKVPDLAGRVWCPPSVYSRANAGDDLHIWKPSTQGKHKVCSLVPLHRGVSDFTQDYARESGYFTHNGHFDVGAWERATQQAWRERAYRMLEQRVLKGDSVQDALRRAVNLVRPHITTDSALQDFVNGYKQWQDTRYV